MSLCMYRYLIHSSHLSFRGSSPFSMIQDSFSLLTLLIACPQPRYADPQSSSGSHRPSLLLTSMRPVACFFEGRDLLGSSRSLTSTVQSIFLKTHQYLATSPETSRKTQATRYKRGEKRTNSQAIRNRRLPRVYY